MAKLIDFDNKDLAIIMIAAIIITLIVGAAWSTAISFQQALGFMEKLLYVFAAIIIPGGAKLLPPKE